MRNKSLLQLLRSGCVIFSTLVAACATVQGPPPPSPEEIVALAKSGAPAQDIIRRMQESGAVYPLSASQLARLREQGVPDEVIDYMNRTYLEAVRREEAMRQSFFYGPPYYSPYHFGVGPPWWW
ncbi:MAG TPA: hypothetical protein VFB01_01845 [Burkholderiales bacterium]|nr:hypothetical protein [Burkholderiales bacterium]